jgi:glucose/mannose-6-phosphate isomerase
MSTLDNRSLPKQFDATNYLSHILDIPGQLKEGFDLADDMIVPALFAQAKQVVFLVTGEMIPLGLSLVAMMQPYARVPAVVVQDYTIPHWVGSDTLVIAIDYTGTTESVILAFREAATRRARLLAVTVGGDLGREARRVRAPHIALAYGAPARIAFYYILSCLTQILKKLDFVEHRSTVVEEAMMLTHTLLENIGLEMEQYRNSAKQLAEKVVHRPTIIVGSGPLVGIAKRWQLMFSATGKVVTTSSTLAEFNDTIINGLTVQTKSTDSEVVIMLQSKYDHQRNKIQQSLTYQVAQTQKFVYEQIFMHPSGSLFGEIVLASLMGDMISYYLAWLQSKDPEVTETTTFIKQQLAEQALLE